MTNKNSKIYKAEDVLEKLNHWYGIIDYYLANTDQEAKARKDFHYIRDAVLDFNKDKHTDHLRFQRKFKALFGRQNKELTKEVYEVKKELYETKIEKQILEKKLKEK